MTRYILTLLLLALPYTAHAHSPGSGGLVAGILHPLTGWDHLLIMLAAGWLAVRWARSNLVLGGWAVAMLAGFGAGAVWPQIAQEGWMVAGLLGAGSAALLTHRRALDVVPLLMGGAIFAQGLLHGAEAPVTAQATFGAGFVLISAAGVTVLALLARHLHQLRPRLQLAIGMLAVIAGLAKAFA